MCVHCESDEWLFISKESAALCWWACGLTFKKQFSSSYIFIHPKGCPPFSCCWVRAVWLYCHFHCSKEMHGFRFYTAVKVLLAYRAYMFLLSGDFIAQNRQMCVPTCRSQLFHYIYQWSMEGCYETILMAEKKKKISKDTEVFLELQIFLPLIKQAAWVKGLEQIPCSNASLKKPKTQEIKKTPFSPCLLCWVAINIFKNKPSLDQSWPICLPASIITDHF